MLETDKNYPQHELAERLRLALEAASVSPSMLAKICGVTKQAVNGWLTTGRISKHHLPTVSDVTRMPLEYFLEHQRASTPKTRKAWEKITVVAKAATMALAVLVGQPDKADAAVSISDARTVHYVKLLIKRCQVLASSAFVLIINAFAPVSRSFVMFFTI